MGSGTDQVELSGRTAKPLRKILVALILLTVSAMTLFAQGRVNFNNLQTGNAIVVLDWRGVPSPLEGYAGAEFSIQLLWAPAGIYPTEADFLAAVIGRTPGVPFFGRTGSPPAHGPIIDGAGLFDVGPVQIGPPGNYTMQARGWYNGGLYPTYESSLVVSLGGLSRFSIISVTAPPDSAIDTYFEAFDIILIPAPATFALATLGATCLLLFC